MFDYLGKHPARAKRFANAMKATTAGQLDTPMSGTKAFSWASIGSGTVVDVGGSEGHASMELAEAFPSLSFIVQDRPEVISGAQSKVPPSLQSRVSFMAHDFFTEQPVKADCYLFRRIFHNWPDAYCVRILRNLIPALQPGARIVINDNVMPEPNTVGLLAERKIRYILHVLTYLYSLTIVVRRTCSCSHFLIHENGKVMTGCRCSTKQILDSFLLTLLPSRALLLVSLKPFGILELIVVVRSNQSSMLTGSSSECICLEIQIKI